MSHPIPSHDLPDLGGLDVEPSSGKIEKNVVGPVSSPIRAPQNLDDEGLWRRIEQRQEQEMEQHERERRQQWRREQEQWQRWAQWKKDTRQPEPVPARPLQGPILDLHNELPDSISDPVDLHNDGLVKSTDDTTVALTAVLEPQNDREAVLAAIQLTGYALQYASPELRNDKEIVYTAVVRNSYALEYASSKLQGDKEIVLIAVKQNGRALQYASPELQSDKGIVLNAIQQNGDALKYASLKLRNDKDLVLTALQHDKQGLILRYASPELQDDKEIVLIAVKQNGDALQYASPELRNDKEIVLIAIQQNGCALQHASLKLRNDKEIVLIAVKQNGRALQYASPELQNNEDIVLEAVQQNERALQYASPGLQNFNPIVLNRIKNLESKFTQQESIILKLQTQLSQLISQALDVEIPDLDFDIKRPDVPAEISISPGLASQTEAKFRSLYNVYIREHEKDLLPRSIIVYTDEKSPPEVYKSFAAAYPHIQGRSGLYRFTYYGPEAPFITINYVGVTTGFGGDRTYGLSNLDIPGNLVYNGNYAYLPVRIRWRPEPQGGQPDPKMTEIQTGVDGTRYIDVKMIVDTGAVVSLGPESVLTQLGLTPGQVNSIYGVMDTRHQSRDVGVTLELPYQDPLEPRLSIPIQLNYVLRPVSLLRHRDYTPEDANRGIKFSSQWILGRDFQQYFQMLWTNVVASKTTVDFILSPQHQSPDGTFLEIQRSIYPDRECVIESPVDRNHTDLTTFQVRLPQVSPPPPIDQLAGSRAGCCVIL